MANEQLAGEVILAEDIIIPGYILKGTSESVTSSTALQNDDELFTVLPVGQWRVELLAHVTGASAGDIKMDWTFSGTAATWHRACLGPGVTNTTANDGTMQSTARGNTTAVIYGTGDPPTTLIREDHFLDVSVSGTMQMRWAQQTSSGTATSVTSGSRMYVTKVTDA